MKRYQRVGLLLLTLLLIGALILSLPSCRRMREAAREREMDKLKAEKTEGCVNFTGVWDTNRGDLEVLQRGCDAEGTLKGIGGGVYLMTGKVTNETWDFDWKGPGGRGKGYLTMDPAGGKFIGEHGEGENNTGGGSWDGMMIE